MHPRRSVLCNVVQRHTQWCSPKTTVNDQLRVPQIGHQIQLITAPAHNTGESPHGHLLPCNSCCTESYSSFGFSMRKLGMVAGVAPTTLEETSNTVLTSMQSAAKVTHMNADLKSKMPSSIHNSSPTCSSKMPIIANPVQAAAAARVCVCQGPRALARAATQQVTHQRRQERPSQGPSRRATTPSPATLGTAPLCVHARAPHPRTWHL